MTTAMHSPEQFVGVWLLDEWRIEYEDGGITTPYGAFAAGRLTYHDDGIVDVVIARGETAQSRPDISYEGQDGWKALSPKTSFYYEAGWSLSGESVIHAVKRSLNPEMVGTRQVRTAKFDGPNHLALSTFEAIKGGQQRAHILRWTRQVGT